MTLDCKAKCSNQGSFHFYRGAKGASRPYLRLSPCAQTLSPCQAEKWEKAEPNAFISFDVFLPFRKKTKAPFTLGKTWKRQSEAQRSTKIPSSLLTNASLCVKITFACKYNLRDGVLSPLGARMVSTNIFAGENATFNTYRGVAQFGSECTKNNQ